MPGVHALADMLCWDFAGRLSPETAEQADFVRQYVSGALHPSGQAFH